MFEPRCAWLHSSDFSVSHRDGDEIFPQWFHVLLKYAFPWSLGVPEPGVWSVCCRRVRWGMSPSGRARAGRCGRLHRLG